MKKLVLIGIYLLLVLIGIYLVWPSPRFPAPPPGVLQSAEPADTESINRRSYFTNLSRGEIMDYYDQQFAGLIQYRLDHPHEEAQALIRDQTQSSYLEEIVHPWRESLYINVFVPTMPKDEINRNGVHYLNKVIVRYVPSHFVTRLTVLMMTCIIIWWLYKEYDRI